MIRMDIQTERSKLIKRLEQINDLSLIQALKHMVDFGLREKEERVSIDQYNKELEDANARIEAGDYVSHEDVVKESASWLK